MQEAEYLEFYDRVNSELVKFKTNEVYRSVGSNIFIKFGRKNVSITNLSTGQKFCQEEQSEPKSNRSGSGSSDESIARGAMDEEENRFEEGAALSLGKFLSSTEITNGNKELFRKEWTIWIGDASWRLLKNGKHVVDSEEPLEKIDEKVQELLGKRFISMQNTSQYLDAQFAFEDGYLLTTFFNTAGDNQWMIFLPDSSEIEVDCSTLNKRKTLQRISSHYPIERSHQYLTLPCIESFVKEILYDDNNQIIIELENKNYIYLRNVVWRLEKESLYITGSRDEDENDTDKITQLKGKKLQSTRILNIENDTIFEFSDGYQLTTFSVAAQKRKWSVHSKKAVLFKAQS